MRSVEYGVYSVVLSVELQLSLCPIAYKGL